MATFNTDVSNASQLKAAILAASVGGANAGANTTHIISFTADITLATINQELSAINLVSGDNLIIFGAGHVLNGNDVNRGFYVHAGQVAIQNLTIDHALARGGAGGDAVVTGGGSGLGGGGGAGIGGGLVVGGAATVTLDAVNFTNDSAVGGFGGAGTVGGATYIGGGGGGMGGAGGAVVDSLPGGGGGIGLLAAGGQGMGVNFNGGIGIVPGIAAADSRTGSLAGAGGGGGGSGSLGTGGGIGPNDTNGTGGQGGGGGGASGLGIAGGGGFGGGGAGGAVGGFGGGEGGGNQPGFGGGSAPNNDGGGGAGMGGAIFVLSGGTITYNSGNLASSNSVAGSGNASAFGPGIFALGAANIDFNPGAGQTVVVADAIADELGSMNGVGALSAIQLRHLGAGTLSLQTANSFGAGIQTQSGVLSLATAGAAGLDRGPITMVDGYDSTLRIGSASAVPTNTIKGFTKGDVIDVRGIGTATGATLGGGNVLTVSGGSSPISLQLDAAANYTDRVFSVAADGAGGTNITVDGPFTFNMGTGPGTTAEGNTGTTNFNFSIFRSSVVPGTSSLTYTVSGSGVNPADASDFVGGVFPTGTITFTGSETYKTVDIPVAGDTGAEGDETFTITLSNPSANAQIRPTTSTSATIQNDDAAVGSLAIVANQAPKPEGAGTTPFTFTVTRTGDTSGAASVNWAVNAFGPTPANGNDFVGGTYPTGTANFAIGATAVSFTVNVAGDAVVENDEGFRVTLTSATGATIGTAMAQAEILNDDVTIVGGGGGDEITPPPVVPATPVTTTPSSGSDNLRGTAGPDSQAGGTGADTIDAGAGDDRVDGDQGDDSVSGGDGADEIRGLDDNDRVDGGNGDDTVNGNKGADTVSGGEGADYVYGGRDNDSVDGGAGDDPHVNGNVGSDTVHGGAGRDSVFGGQGDDSVYGDDGDDRLSGDLGNDNLFGGAGADRFVFARGGGQDWVGDFSFAEGDRIQLAPGTVFTVADYLGQAVIVLADGSQIGLAGVASTAFSAEWVAYS